MSSTLHITEAFQQTVGRGNAATERLGNYGAYRNQVKV